MITKKQDTSQRDIDQVVYRATKGHGVHTRIVMVDQLWLWVLDERGLAPVFSTRSRSFGLTETYHLFPDTVITAFPKRWGRNSPDSSGIHKSLRKRLARPGCKIMSAWHLGKSDLLVLGMHRETKVTEHPTACIVIDQCSNVFFDRTKLQDSLSLKQQQASIVEAKAALDRADQSVAQAEREYTTREGHHGLHNHDYYLRKLNL